ncbi:uncharacterized protein BT62DRAFT_331033 [Guyanagaster necrorhizus]|uniref:Uncharacterized protein n=1 Tax=Guyanagaster necrorhizus TaxID=856835 RepID=A0A9P7VMT6_9AGAR|nr:uncharacterized protein BT62DRAFT_331033 [Guyanagaster necrorhizus MCA 3950]KAG7443423.1 hypothetical protein BT62DRAFT_331033 [Guyanagaster necrorhizus MCA 3950]
MCHALGYNWRAVPSTQALKMSSLPLPVPIADIPSELAKTLGALFIGATIASVCYGLTILQTVIYYKLNPDDPWIFRYGIALLWILDTLHVALSTHALYFYLIQSFGNYIALLSKIIWSFPVTVFPHTSLICDAMILRSR